MFAAHAAFLAHRYGERVAQLGGTLDERMLLRGRRAYAAAWSAAVGARKADPHRGLRPADAAGRRGGGGGAAATAAATAAALRDRQCHVT